MDLMVRPSHGLNLLCRCWELEQAIHDTRLMLLGSSWKPSLDFSLVCSNLCDKPRERLVPGREAVQSHLGKRALVKLGKPLALPDNKPYIGAMFPQSVR